MELDEAIKAMLARWRATHKKSINEWSQCQRMMIVHVGNVEEYHIGRYNGHNNPSDHLIEFHTLWESQPKDEWVYAFIHTLYEMPRYWYMSAKFRREITTLEELTIFFTHTFIFTDAIPYVHNALQLICDIVIKLVSVTYRVDRHAHC